jgi:hypothetical protein
MTTTSTQDGIISIAYISGRYEVAMFIGDEQRGNSVPTFSVGAAYRQAEKWQARYKYSIKNETRWQKKLADVIRHEMMIDADQQDNVSWWAA